MIRPAARRSSAFAVLFIVVLTGLGLLAFAAPPMGAVADARTERGPDVVVLRELESTYEPVPFDHKSHADMAEMWDGCVTCHHHTPEPTLSADERSTITALEGATQADCVEVPACKSCHAVAPAEVDIHVPSLKGAYHRQCLGCHKEWMHENACVICHAPKQNGNGTHLDPAPDDILGRMHPPIQEPSVVNYTTRFTPAAGGNVLFRHRQHTVDFGIKCVECHRRDNCSDCHNPSGKAIAVKPMRPGMTWEESHAPCMACHSEDRCHTCHFKPDQLPPAPFDHRNTGQLLDKDHAGFPCAECHLGFGPDRPLTCGDLSCHREGPTEYPAKRPGPRAGDEPIPPPAEGGAGQPAPSPAESELP